jgi:DNA-binding transcriptional regulator YiaG
MLDNTISGLIMGCQVIEEIIVVKVVEITKEEAIAMFRTQQNLADALGISQAAVAQWPAGKPIPETQAMKIRFILRPELWD